MNTADFTAHNDRKVNGQRHYKRTTMVNGVTGRRVYTTFWRAATEYAPGFVIKITHHFQGVVG